MITATRDDIDPDWFGRIFAFWIGDAPLSEARLAGLQSLAAVTECKVHLVTDETVSTFILPQAPLHPAYPLLTPIHRSDYLRAYFMHHYGGGYSDIKPTRQTWKPTFETLRSNDAFGAGFPELWKGTGRFHRSCVLGDYYYLEDRTSWPKAYLRYQLQNLRHKSVIGNGAFIFKPETPFTRRWLSIVERRLDLLLPLLRENPGRYPKEVGGRDYGEGPSRYPVPWSFLLGDILGPLSWLNRDRLLRILPPPDFTNYE
jgi:hypothetical protein